MMIKCQRKGGKQLPALAAAVCVLGSLCLAACGGAGGGTVPSGGALEAAEQAASAAVPAGAEAGPSAGTPAVSIGGDAGEWSPDIRFTTTDGDGTEYTDAIFAEHDLTMVNYWAYWCGPCVGELQDLQRLAEDYADRGFQVYGISDAGYEAENRKTLQALEIQYPSFRYVSAFDDYLLTGYVPTTIFVDSQGRVLDEPYVGSRSYDLWSDVIEGYLP